MLIVFFFFNDTATTEIYTLSLHAALPISPQRRGARGTGDDRRSAPHRWRRARRGLGRRRARPRAPAGGAVARARDQRDGRGAAYEPRPSAARRARDRGDGPHRGIVLESRI